MKSPHILLMAGGTGGHIFPALAVAKYLSNEGWATTWLGSAGGMEERLVPENRIRLETISVAGVRGKSLLTRLLSPLMLLRAVLEAGRIIRRHKPDVVLGMGGFASGPGGLASWLMGYPLCIHEQNAIAGMTNRYLAKIARYRLSAFPSSLPRETEVVGNPVREDILTIAPPEQRLRTRSGALKILVVGGSRGAAVLNETLPQTIAKLLSDFPVKVRHQAGSGRSGQLLQHYSEALVDSPVDLAETVEVDDFITDMREAYEWADLMICRSGALTVSELAAVGMASILIPFPHAVDDHQTINGRYLVDAGAAKMIHQTELSADTLAGAIRSIGDADGCLKMAINARKLAKVHATQTVADYCIKASGIPAQGAM